MEFIAKNLKETEKFGEALGKTFQPGDLILLYGDLGSGKTTLVQNLAHGLGVVSKEYIRSPSFTLINEYRGNCPIYHIDLYRIDSPVQLENLGLEEIVYSESAIVFIEWAEKLHLPNTRELWFGIESRLEIHIEIMGEEKRRFHIRPIFMDDRFSLIFPLH